MIKTPLSTVLGGAFWTPGATVIGGSASDFDQQIQKLFATGEQGFAYDPNDLTAEKINWRKNLLLNTEDFVALNSSAFSAVKHADGWLLTALTSHIAGGSLGALYPIGSNTANVGSGTIVRSIEFKKGTANEIRLGGASDSGTVFIDLNTLAVTRNGGNTPYAITPLSDGWYRLETWHYNNPFFTTQLSHMFGWGMSRTSSQFDVEGQVGSTVFARNPSFAFVPYETTKSIPYQAITDFNTDFIRAFPLHTLYQDAAGTIPVTAAGQPVGLILDKSKGLVLGGELNLNSTFSVDLSGWFIGAAISATRSNGEAVVTFGGSLTTSGNNWFALNSPVSLGDRVVIEFDATYVSGGNLQVGSSYTLGATILSAENGGSKKRYKVEVTCLIPAVDRVANFAAPAGTVWKLDNVSVKKIEGNHAFQTTSASRPVLQWTYIYGEDILTKPLDFNADPWTLLGAGTSAVNNSFTVTGSVGAGPVFKNLTVNKNYIVEVEWTATVPVTIEFLNASGSAGTKLHQSNTGKAVFSFKATDSNFYLRVPPFTGPSTITVTKATIKEATGYRTDQNYLAFDGADDSLQTGNIDFTGTDEMSLFAGFNCLASPQAYTLLAELSSNAQSSDGVFQVAAKDNLTTSSRVSSKGTIQSNNQFTNLTDKRILSANLSISADMNSARINATNQLIQTDQGTGNYGNYPLNIGRRGDGGLVFSGHIYSLIGVGKLTSNRETLNIEKYLAKCVGASLNV